MKPFAAVPPPMSTQAMPSALPLGAALCDHACFPWRWQQQLGGPLLLVPSSNTCAVFQQQQQPTLMSRCNRLVLRHSSVPILVLWNVFMFWAWVAWTHFPTLLIESVWKTALGICVVVGITLNTNAYALWKESQPPGAATGVGAFVRGGPCSAIRFFMIPFCVASYSGMVNRESAAALGSFAKLGILVFPVSDRAGQQLVRWLPDYAVIFAVDGSLTLLMLLLGWCSRRRQGSIPR
jgi:hypothetical protein